MSLECVYHLEWSGRFDLAFISSDGPLTRPQDPWNHLEYDILGSVQTLEDKWKVAYNDWLERLKQQLVDVAPYPPEHALCMDNARPQVCILGTETGMVVEGIHLNCNGFPIVTSLGLPCFAIKPQSVADEILWEFTLNVEQQRAFVLIM